MPTPLEKARKNPKSMKARILTSARKLFGRYGFHGTTTRMIAKDVGIDISTLYYHWGEKNDLYEAVMLDLNEGMQKKLVEVEKMVKGRPLQERLVIALDEMVDYFFKNPEISNLTIFRYFTRTRHKTGLDTRVPEFVSNIAYSMGLTKNKADVSVEARLKVLTIMNSIHNFVSGESFFLPMLNVDHDTYVRHVKETLKFYNVAAYAGIEPKTPPKKG